MKIALDVMGSDNAPEVEILGMKQVLQEFDDLNICLYGKKDIINHGIEEFKERLEIVDAQETIGMHEQPSVALKTKANSSIALAIKSLKEKQNDAVVSAGNTGAVMAFAISLLGCIAGVDRPALAAPFPTPKGNTLMVDIGANVNVKPINLYQFAVMGSIAASYIFKKANPTVGLLNVGKEQIKGPEVNQTAYKLLSESELNFIGNIEGQDILKGVCDVIVCDGYVGNIVLKFGEGIAEVIHELLRDYLASESKYRVRRWFSKPVFSEFLNRLSYEEYGGALLLGVKGTVIIAHGRSTVKAMKNAIRTAVYAARSKITEHIEEKFHHSVNRDTK
ncbi:MAG: phosphate acyltransferase PlsX [candidate division WOR-3 bacterium]